MGKLVLTEGGCAGRTIVMGSAACSPTGPGPACAGMAGTGNGAASYTPVLWALAPASAAALLAGGGYAAMAWLSGACAGVYGMNAPGGAPSANGAAAKAKG